MAVPTVPESAILDTGSAETTPSVDISGFTIANGDLLLACLCTDDANNTVVHSMLSSGYTKQADYSTTDGSGGLATTVWTKVADGTETSVDWSTSVSETPIGMVCRITGHDATTPWDVNEVNGTESTDTPSSPSITTITNESLCFFLYCSEKNSAGTEDTGYPSGTTGLYHRFGDEGGGNIGIGLAYKGITPSGASGTATWGSITTADAVQYTTFAIRSANPASESLYSGTIDQAAMVKNTYVKIPDATVSPTENTLTVTISAEGSDSGDVVVADNIGVTIGSVSIITSAPEQICCDGEIYTIEGTFKASGNAIEFAENADGSGTVVAGSIDTQDTGEITAYWDSAGSFTQRALGYIRVNDFAYAAARIWKAGTKYAASTGSDGAAGTKAAPYLSIQKLADNISAGEIGYMRGGTYSVSAEQTISGCSGSSGNLAEISGYPGELPNIDQSSNITPAAQGIEVSTCTYLNIVNIKISDAPHDGLFIQSGGNSNINVIECQVTGSGRITNVGGGNGIVVNNSSGNILIYRCDSYENKDIVGSGGNADGFLFGGNGTGCRIAECRAWYNSDDGIDMWDQDNSVIIEDNWIWRSGYNINDTDAGGDGMGVKLGQSTAGANHTVRNNLIWKTKKHGISENANGGEMDIFNNTIFDIGLGLTGYGLTFWGTENLHDVTNNLVHGTAEGDINGASQVTDTYNSWNTPPNVTVTNADFGSVTEGDVGSSGPMGARLYDGSLPDLNGFLELASGSDCIDAGADVGLTYNGSAPDLGAVESDY